MLEQLKIAFISTGIIIIAVPLIGFILGKVQTVIYFIFNLFLDRRTTYYLIPVWLTFPGVIFHELCHFIALTLTGAKAKIINLFRPQADGTLGSVGYYPRGGYIIQALQHSLGSSAPTIIGIIVLFILYIKVLPHLTLTWQHILFWYLFLHIDMSSPDTINYFRGLIILIIPIFLILFFTKFDLLKFLSNYLNNLKELL